MLFRKEIKIDISYDSKYTWKVTVIRDKNDLICVVGFFSLYEDTRQYCSKFMAHSWNDTVTSDKLLDMLY